MKSLILNLFILVPFLVTGQDSTQFKVQGELSGLYSFGNPNVGALIPKISVSSNKSEVGIGLVFPYKVFSSSETINIGESTNHLSGIYAFYNYKINKNNKNSIRLSYSLLFQQSVVFKLNEIKYKELFRPISTLDQCIGYSFKKNIVGKFYLRQNSGIGIITYLSGKESNTSSLSFYKSRFALSGMLDIGLVYAIR